MIRPNPAADQIFLQSWNGAEYFKITNAVGITLITKQIEENHNLPIDISDLVPGQYYMYVFGNDEKWTEAFIKSN